MRRLSILIADDPPDVCALLSPWLRGHHSVCVYTGADAGWEKAMRYEQSLDAVGVGAFVQV